MPKLDFRTLRPTDFEEFCFKLVKELGFINVDWRKGTGHNSSPADRGRDIECELAVEDLDKSKRLEKWFIDCKHHQKGIPPTEIVNLMTWAQAERPDVVLLIASEFLSNPAKDWIKDYQKETKPPFRIKYWERPNLEELSEGKVELLRRYPAVSLSVPDSRQLGVYEALSRRSSRVADMYLGCVYALSQTANPDRYSQAGQSLRELMEKAAFLIDIRSSARRPMGDRLGTRVISLRVVYDEMIGQTTVKTDSWQGSIDRPIARYLEHSQNFFAWHNYQFPKRREQATQVLRSLAHGPLLPTDAEKQEVDRWMEIKDFFTRVAHHQTRVTDETEFTQSLAFVEDLLMRKLNPSAEADVAALDQLLKGGVAE